MNSTNLKYSITVQHNVTGVDEKGHPVKEWQEFASRKAAKRGLSSKEYYAAAAVQSETDIVFTVRYDSVTSQITANMQIVEGSDTEHPYNIDPPVDKYGDKRWLEIRARR
jgi:SPP1 family predicted phage head-tail adaptor